MVRHNRRVELDGEYWHNKPDAKEKDKERDILLKKLGWKIIRTIYKR